MNILYHKCQNQNSTKNSLLHWLPLLLPQQVTGKAYLYASLTMETTKRWRQFSPCEYIIWLKTLIFYFHVVLKCCTWNFRRWNVRKLIHKIFNVKYTKEGNQNNFAFYKMVELQDIRVIFFLFLISKNVFLRLTSI